MNMIRIQKIYNEIVVEQGWEDGLDSKVRLLRIKFNFLMRNVMLCDLESLKKHGNYEVPEEHVYIIKNILIEALNKESKISAWFNHSIDLSISENAIQLFSQLQEPIICLYKQGHICKVTMDEWLASLDAAIDYTNAQKIYKMKLLLEKLRAAAKPLNHTIQYGDMIIEREDGARQYVLRGNHEGVVLDKNLIHKIMDYIGTEKDYFEILNTLVIKFIDNAKATSSEDIYTYALAKSVTDADDGDDSKSTARDIVDEGIASEYLQRFRNIYEFLKNEPQIVKDIEKKAGTTGLLEFFNVAGNEKEKTSGGK